MTRPLALPRAVRRFATDLRASITVEFVIVLPLLFLWFIGSFVFFDLYKTASRAVKATNSIGDMVTRENIVNQELLNQLYLYLDAAMPNSGDTKWMRVSSISFDDTTNDYEVEWSRTVGGGQQLTDADIPDEIMVPISGLETTILTETYVPYTPIADGILSWVNMDAITFRNRVTVNPRYTLSIVWDNTPATTTVTEVADTGTSPTNDDD